MKQQKYNENACDSIIPISKKQAQQNFIPSII